MPIFNLPWQRDRLSLASLGDTQSRDRADASVSWDSGPRRRVGESLSRRRLGTTADGVGVRPERVHTSGPRQTATTPYYSTSNLFPQANPRLCSGMLCPALCQTDLTSMLTQHPAPSWRILPPLFPLSHPRKKVIRRVNGTNFSVTTGWRIGVTSRSFIFKMWKEFIKHLNWNTQT